jgi:hypothetical protein
MLRVTIDAFSGRENPSYVLDGSEARDLLRDVSRRRQGITDVAEGFTGLGLRGVTVEALSDDTESFGLPERFKVGGGSALDEGGGQELAERLIRGLANASRVEPTDSPFPVDEGLINYFLELLDRSPGSGPESILDGPQPSPAAPEDVTCFIERSRFNPGFWNQSGTLLVNNCYNYASNRRTNTFAQPGLGAGHQYTALTCAAVTKAALADGCHRRFDCFPASEAPRRLVALVVAPGVDYHWYRIHSLAEGFWGHKPGNTAARNVDNSLRMITNPETCDRGPYTEFCGYFYTCLSQANRIR